MWRAALTGLFMGAVIAFLIELLRPRRLEGLTEYRPEPHSAAPRRD